MSAIKVILIYEDQQLYPNFYFKESPHEMIGDYTTMSQEWVTGTCTISNFGFGGSNVFVVILPCPPHRKVLGETQEYCSFAISNMTSNITILDRI